MNYYFIKGQNKVFTREDLIDTTLFPQWTKLTEEEENFYLANPTVSVHEIKNLQINTPTPTHEVTLEEYKIQAIAECSNLSLTRIGELVPSYRILNCIVSQQAIANNQTPIYPQEQIDVYMAEANTAGSLCRMEFYRLQTEIDNAATKEIIDEIVATAAFKNINI